MKTLAKWSVDDYHRMIEAGILRDRRVELLAGEIVEMSPEPDIAIVRLPESAYNDRHPGCDDIFWVVEVAKTSLKKDLDLKTSIYASAEIQEYWILDLSARRMIVLREPQNGQYATQQVIREGMIAPLAFPDIQVSVERLLA
jgi:Uma2 family endonuclease